MSARHIRASGFAVAFSLLAGLFASGALAQTTKPAPALPPLGPVQTFSFPAAADPLGTVLVDRERASGQYDVDVRADRTDGDRRIVEVRRQPRTTLNETLVNAVAAPGAVFVDWGTPTACVSPRLSLPVAGTGDVVPFQYNPARSPDQATCRPGRREPIACGPDMDCGATGDPGSNELRFEPRFASAFVEVALVAAADRKPATRLRIEGERLPQALTVAAGKSVRVNVERGKRLTLTAEACADDGACTPEAVSWPPRLCVDPSNTPRATCVVENRTGRTAVTAVQAPVWSIDVDAPVTPAGQLRVIGSFAGADSGRPVPVLECATTCGTLIGKPGELRVASLIMNRQLAPGGDLRVRICGAPADDPALLAATRFFTATDRFGSVHWVCGYALTASMTPRPIAVKFR